MRFIRLAGIAGLTLGLGLLGLATVAAPASATPPGDGGCHTTTTLHITAGLSGDHDCPTTTTHAPTTTQAPTTTTTVKPCGVTASTVIEVAVVTTSTTCPPTVGTPEPNLPAPGTCDGPPIACDPQIVTVPLPTTTAAPAVLGSTGVNTPPPSLPLTGTSTAPLAAGGAGLVALGLVLLAVGRPTGQHLRRTTG